MTIALCEQLVRHAAAFSLAIPTRHGLQLHQIHSMQQLHALLPQWLRIQVHAQAGIGLQCFLDERLEEQFSRLVLVSAGEYAQDLHGLERRIGMSVVSVTQAQDVCYASLGVSGSVMSLPAEPKPSEVFRIPC